MPTLLERLREALSPEYEVQRELATGGMGVVFLAREVALERLVAIKVITPEYATARAVERFSREARILAQLTHPNILAVHRAGEAGGLFFYVMDYITGQTLAERLTQGPLPAVDALKLGSDLLHGLETAHDAGVIHRDIKPSNIFLVGSRVLLGDFGIAHDVRDGTLTDPGAIMGTPAYMAPEQVTGEEVTPRTDLYAVGLVVYEALTGRRWSVARNEKQVDWSGVPFALRGVLRRALSQSPQSRWENAAAFRRALERSDANRNTRRARALTATGLLFGVAATWWLAVSRPFQGPTPALLHLAIGQFRVNGAEAWLGDSLPLAVARQLTGFPDFTISALSGRSPGARPGSVVLEGEVIGRDGALQVDVRSSGSDRSGWWSARATGGAADWRAISEKLSDEILLDWYQMQEGGPLPAAVLPRSPSGFRTLLRAEQLFAAARWGEAYVAYDNALRTDSTCWLCAWRITETERWLNLPHDPRNVAAYRSRIDSFPPRYQSLIRAGFLPLAHRLDTLGDAARRSSFYLADALFGDELFHRGPFVGRSREEAIEPLQRAVRLRPGFAPAWEHLAWALIPEGDSIHARAALDSLRRFGEPRDLSAMLQPLLEMGYVWRFAPARDAAARTAQLLARPSVAAGTALASAPRWMMTFDAPAGAIWLGHHLAAPGAEQAFVRSGLIAQCFGHLAEGRVDSARGYARRLSNRFESVERRLFAAEMDAMLALFHDQATAPAASAKLSSLLTPAPGADGVRRRAAWMSALLASDTASVTSANWPALTDEPEPRPLTRLLAGVRLAARGSHTQALDTTADLAQLDSAGRAGDPFFRAALHLLRADWFAAAGNPDGALRELRWHENLDAVGYLTDDPQAAEVDWALGTLARWRRARLLDGAGRYDRDLCRSYRAVARLWKDGEPLYAARADSAGRRAGELGCEP